MCLTKMAGYFLTRSWYLCYSSRLKYGIDVRSSSIIQCLFHLPHSKMSGSKVFLRKLPRGLDLYYRSTATGGAWRRIVPTDEYFSITVGDRVNDEGARHMAQVRAKTGSLPVDAVIE
jgi:hypothetical protein